MTGEEVLLEVEGVLTGLGELARDGLVHPLQLTPCSVNNIEGHVCQTKEMREAI